MGYGKVKPNISSESVSMRKIIKSKQVELKEKIFKEYEFEDEFDEANFKASQVFYEEHPDAIPPGALDKKPSVSPSRSEKLSDGFILINQSLIKKLVNKYQEEMEFCPKHIKEVVIDRIAESVPSDAMLAGKFFESHVLGSTTHGDPVLDLPRKRLSKKQEALLKSQGKPLIGEKKIDQIRLETQIERFKIKAKQYETQIITGVNTHVNIYKHWSDRYLLVGELDWFPTPILYQGALRLAIIDVKVTSNVETTFGNFCWGAPQYMDHLQADMYHYLVRDIDFDLNPHLKGVVNDNIIDIIENENILFLYWVWGYQKEPLEYQEKIIERGYRDDNNSLYRQQELKERIRKAIAILEREESFGWQANPVPEICKYCPLNKMNGGNCESSIIIRI